MKLRLTFVVALLLTLPLVAAERSHPRIATNGDGYLVVWNESNAVYGARLNSAGIAIGPARFRIADGTVGDVAWNGTTYVVAYKAGPVMVATIEVGRLRDIGGRQFHFNNVPDCGGIELAAAETATLIASPVGKRILSSSNRLLHEERHGANCGPVAVAAGRDTFAIARSDGWVNWSVYTHAGRSTSGGCCAVTDSTPTDDPTGIAFFNDGTNNYVPLWTNGTILYTREHQNVLFEHAVTAPRAVWDGGQYVVTVMERQTLNVLRYDANREPVGVPFPIENLREGEVADIDAQLGRGAVVWINEAGVIRVGLFDVTSFAGGRSFLVIRNLLPVTRHRPVR